MPDTGPTPIVAIIGPTASGKTGLSLDLAERLGGEIVNTDAMQVYRGMDIGTAKLPPAERRGITHHLLDTQSVRDPATVAQFQEWARPLIATLRSAGTPPILVGGSGLYTRAILDRFEFPATDPVVRGRLEAELAAVGARALHARLADVDPAAASSGRSRSSSSPGRRTPARCPSSSTPTRTPCSSRSRSTAPRSTPGSSSGCARCTTPGSSPRSSGCSARVWPRA